MPGSANAPQAEHAERYPTYSDLRISDQLKLIGIGVSPSTVAASENRAPDPPDREASRPHRRSRTDVEAPYSGYLLCQDTYFTCAIKGIGKIYMQSVVGAHSSLGFAKV